MKKILSVLVALMLVALPAVALVFPLPIAGQVTSTFGGFPVSGLVVTVKNVNTGEVLTTMTASDGRYLIDWANSVYKYREGDTFIISVLDSTVTKRFTGGVDVTANFAIGIAPSTITTVSTTLPPETTTLPPITEIPETTTTVTTTTIPPVTYSAPTLVMVLVAGVIVLGGYQYYIRKGKVVKRKVRAKKVKSIGPIQ